MVPLEDLAKLFGKKVEQYDEGLIIVSEDGKTFDTKRDAETLKTVRNLLIYEEPTREEIYSDYLENADGSHPRVLVPSQDVFGNLKSKLERDDTLQEWFQKLMAQADNTIRNAHIEYDIFNQNSQIQILRKFRTRAELLGMAYHLTGDEKYAAYLFGETQMAATVSNDWRKTGYLNAGTLMMGLGIAYDWLYDYMDEAQRAALRKEIITRHIMPGLEAHRGTLVAPDSSWTSVMSTTGWVTWNSNWNIICNSGMMVMASAMMEDEPELCKEIMDYGLKSLRYYTPAFYPDGAALESLGYLTVILSDFARLMSTMTLTYGTTYGILEAPGISQMPYVIAYLTGPVGINNFGDAGLSKSVQPAETMMFARLLGDRDLAQLRINEVERGVSVLETMDFLWYAPDSERGSVKLEQDRYFRVGETGSMRSSWADSNGMFLSYHAGDNAINHSHMDTGNFVLDAMGERWAIELGSDGLSYSMNPASGITSRWQLYYLRTEGHNTLTMKPGQDPGQEQTAFSPVTKFESREQGSYTIVDMTPAYASVAKKAHRGYMLHQSRRVATVRDEVELKSPSDIYWFMHTNADVEILEGGREAVLTQNGKKLYAKLESKQDVQFTVMDAKPFSTSPKLNFQAGTEGIRKLTVCAPSALKLEMSVSFTPLYEDGEKMAEILKIPALEKWSLSSKAAELPYLDGITLDGVPVEGFEQDCYTYEVGLPFYGDKIPVVAASGNKEISISQAEGINGEAMITVKDPVKQTGNRYYVNFYVKDITGEPENAEKLAPAALETNGALDAGNVKENAFDGDFNTRFSTGKLGDWLIADLGETKQIDYIGMAFFLGNERQASYEVFVSDDKENWTEVVPRASTSGTTLDFETKRIDSVNARYVKIVGYGTSAGVWFSPSEIAFYSRK